MGKQKITTSHEEIKNWAEKYGGRPQIIDDTGAGGDTQGVRIDFPGNSDEAFLAETKVRNASWEEFFEKFEEQGLAFSYREEVDLKDLGEVFRSYRLLNREEG